jgi:Flp pilus assembly protein TadG
MDGQRGQAVVEFALVVPFLSTLLFSLVGFGVIYNQHIELTSGAASAVHLLSISRGQTTDPCSTTSQAVYAAAPGLVQKSFGFSYSLNGQAYTGTSCKGAETNLVAGQTVQLTVTYPCGLTVMGHTFLPACQLTSNVEERVQ